MPAGAPARRASCRDETILGGGKALLFDGERFVGGRRVSNNAILQLGNYHSLYRGKEAKEAVIYISI